MKRNCKLVKIVASVMAFLLVCLFPMPEFVSDAKDAFISRYIQTVYNQKNGIGSNEVNCLYQSSSGYIWVGTDGGLYRSNGSEFQSINLWDTDRTDVYSINCMIQDSKGRMWIGTDNYGLFYIEDGENYHLQDEYYDGLKTIIDICETDDGSVYVATTNGLYTCSKDSSGVMRLEPYVDSSIEGYEFTDIESVRDDVWAIYGSNSIYVLNNNAVQCVLDSSEITSDELNCIECLDEQMYVGTTGRDIIHYSSRAKYSVLTAGVEGINSLMMDTNGYIWACSDNGLGYFDLGRTFVKTSECEIDNYISDMIQDYEGNYWISSSRMGVLLLSKSKFADYNMYSGMPEAMVNSVYCHGNYRYIGTDDGLIIYDGMNERVNNELTDMLTGISVRHITSDSDGNLWISTFRKYGVVKVTSDGTISNIGRGAGLPSIAINCTLPLYNGDIAVATDEGVAILNQEGALVHSYGEREGIVYSNVLCLYQDDDKLLYAGTDGGGIYVINSGVQKEKIVNYDIDSGLNSNVVSAIEEGKEGLWIGTDNGLCFYNEAFRAISNIEYSNSIYDLIIRDDFVWIIGSMGVLRSTEEELLGSSGISGRYFSMSDGLTKSINTICDSYMDNAGVLYLCCDTGICTLDTQNIPYNLTPPRIKVTAIDIDGVRYEFDDLADGLRIKSDVSRITIDFAVFSFNNRNNIQVEYSLEGFDEEPIVINGNEVMEAVYTNLDGGVYKFVINAYNGDGTACEESVSFIIEKETSLLEDPIARVAILFAILLVFVLLIFSVFRVTKLLKNKNSALEKLSKEHEVAVKSSSAKNDYLANMSNEIKTPINAMMAKADELLHVVGEESGYRDSIKGIYDIGSDIINKVDDIILLAKIEAGKVDMVRAPYSITTMIYELSEFAIEKLGDKTVKFFVEIGENVTDIVVGDGDKVKDIMIRLLDNAVKYTKEGSITLSVDCYEYAERSHQDMLNVVFSISDTGIGIHEERLDNIFEVYNIADNMKNNPHSGNGVGLAIVKGYADIVGGDITVESVYGAGSTFTFSVDQKIADRMSAGYMRSKIEDTLSKEVAEQLWLPEVNALLVDDEEVSREVAIKVLAPFEMKIDVASSGVSAIDMVMNNDYDVIFMDLSMPIMNGVDAMKEIRELEGDKYNILPIISMDTDAIEENKAKLLAEGFTDSMVKPIEFRRVAAILKDCLPEDKLKEKTSDIKKYIEESRYSEGLYKLMPAIDVENAIEKIGGSIDVFNKLIRVYYNQNSMAAEELGEKVGKDVRGFKAKLHAIRTNSINIGAYNIAREASALEAAINNGKRDSQKEKLDRFTDNLIDLLLLIEEYLSYIESVSGMTDEEYALRNAKEQELSLEELETNMEEYVAEGQENVIIENDLVEDNNAISVIDIDILRIIKDSASAGDFDMLDDKFEELLECSYGGEDREFIEVLKEAVVARNVDTISELVTTYIDLKM